jgi:precorrin-3B synthase
VIAPALKNIYRRGACPGLSVPMATGDGLLVRFSPIGTLSLDAFGALCKAAERYGNGIIEVTARGNIQVRGLRGQSAPAFADAIAALDIAAEDGVPIFCSPLTGLDPEELIDTSTIAADIRNALARSPLASRLNPKVSIALDGGGAYRLDVASDIQLHALIVEDGSSFAIEVAGRELGLIATRDAVAAVSHLLDVIARYGREARARDIVSERGVEAFRTAISGFLTLVSPRESGELSLNSLLREDEQSLIGAFRLRDGSFAYGIALSFGHSDAVSLRRLIDAAEAAGAHGFRTAPDRTLLAIGLQPASSVSFAAGAKDLGFVVDARDPRRHVVACAGAPICGSGHIAARAMAPAIAAAATPHLEGAFKIHVSGCAKGCAHPAPAALTIVGTEAGCAVVGNGSARDTPFMTIATNELTGKIAELIRDLQAGASHA